MIIGYDLCGCPNYQWRGVEHTPKCEEKRHLSCQRAGEIHRRWAKEYGSAEWYPSREHHEQSLGAEAAEHGAAVRGAARVASYLR